MNKKQNKKTYQNHPDVGFWLVKGLSSLLRVHSLAVTIFLESTVTESMQIFIFFLNFKIVVFTLEFISLIKTIESAFETHVRPILKSYSHIVPVPNHTYISN